MVKLYNTLNRREEELKPIKQGSVGLYSCGPTVYAFAHIGNLRAYIFVDVLRRTLELNNVKVKHVMNITDVGHLVGDADEGEDKMIVAMRREGKSAWDIAEFYTQAFLADMEKLQVMEPDVMPRATAHIAQQIEMIQSLEKNGFTYRTSDGVYFDTSKLADYGKLSGQKSEDKKGGARVDLGEKKNPTDFALWKFSTRSSPPQSSLEKGGREMQREMEWESPWGVGFPGWHIECSAMSIKYLGVPFDIHTGGVDHIAVHHENELAQTEGALHKLQANIWMHNEFLSVDGGKMSKSLGNMYIMQDVLDRRFEPLAFRYLCLGAHYRTKLNFTWEALKGAQNALQKLYERARELEAPAIGCADYERDFLEAVSNDLNTPQGLAVMWKMLDDGELPSAGKAQSLLYFDRVLGLGLENYIAKTLEIPADVQALVADRQRAREEKDWARSDELRAQIQALGYEIDDRAVGTRLRKVA